ncbi:hypothetical protein AVEN_102050-1, partial [Araneus ventricosus]
MNEFLSKPHRGLMAAALNCSITNIEFPNAEKKAEEKRKKEMNSSKKWGQVRSSRHDIYHVMMPKP